MTLLSRPKTAPLPKFVTLVEVGPRDGLQNEAAFVPTAVKLDLIAKLKESGLRIIEATAFVSPKWVPQMRDHTELMRGLTHDNTTRYPVLVPNMQGFEAALAAGARDISLFASASESFSQQNTNCSIATSLTRFEPVMIAAKHAGISVRGYVSCVVGCPYEGHIAPNAVRDVASALHAMGCSNISLGDTIGCGNPITTRHMIDAVATHVPITALAGHFHDTHSAAMANIFAALEMGVTTFDSSIAGLGGCPYAPGASGNIATEDLVWFLHSLGIATGVDLERLREIVPWIRTHLGPLPR